MWRRIVFCLVLLFLYGLPVHAKVYQCQGRNGATLLTDRPKGLEGCVPVDTAAPSPPGGYIAPIEQPEPVQPLDRPLPMPPNGFPSIPQAPSQEQANSATSAQPRSSEAPEAGRCTPRVNPLNPFAGMNCPPASGDISGAAKKPCPARSQHVPPASLTLPGALHIMPRTIE